MQGFMSVPRCIVFGTALFFCIVAVSPSSAQAVAAVGFKARVVGSAVATLTTEGGTTQASGSTFLIYISDPNQNISIPADSKGNNYTQIGTTLTFGSSKVSRWIKENGSGGSNHTITVNWTSGTADPTVFFVELTGVTASSRDTAASNQGTDVTSAYTISTGATTAQADEIAIAFFGDDKGGVHVRSESTGFVEVTTLKPLDNWLAQIMQTWKFL